MNQITSSGTRRFLKRHGLFLYMAALVAFASFAVTRYFANSESTWIDVAVIAVLNVAAILWTSERQDSVTTLASTGFGLAAAFPDEFVTISPSRTTPAECGN